MLMYVKSDGTLVAATGSPPRVHRTQPLLLVIKFPTCILHDGHSSAYSCCLKKFFYQVQYTNNSLKVADILLCYIIPVHLYYEYHTIMKSVALCIKKYVIYSKLFDDDYYN